MSPRKQKRRVQSDPVVEANSRTLEAFEKVVNDRLKPVLGVDGLKRVRTELALVTSAGGGVIIQTPLQFPKGFSEKRLGRKSEIVAILSSSIPLTDPISRLKLDAGVYAWAVRRVGGNVFAFDFFNQRGAPVLSTLAREKDDGGTDAGDTPLIDIDISGNDGPDSLWPPGSYLICASFYIWQTCFFIRVPEIPWPW